jgi:hypothetical protein
MDGNWPCKDKIFYEAPEGVIYCGDCRERVLNGR